MPFNPKQLDRYITECISTCNVALNWPNAKQHESMMNAFSQDFTLIQGPPGTGKTITGVILAHSFFQYNKTQPDCGTKKAILYVSASNRAVDVFGNYLVNRLRMRDDVDKKTGNVYPDCVRYISAVRIYSQQIQNN